MAVKKIDLEARRNEDVLETNPSVNARTARSNFSRLVDTARIDHERVVITEHGEPAAAIIPIRDLRVLEQLPDLNWVNTISDAEIRELDVQKLKELLGGERKKDDKDD